MKCRAPLRSAPTLPTKAVPRNYCLEASAPATPTGDGGDLLIHCAPLHTVSLPSMARQLAAAAGSAGIRALR
eukprot:6500843-Pyramimonas_sp.AAC.1